MPLHDVTLEIDGVIVHEKGITADDGQKAIKAAIKKHPTIVISVVPQEDPSLFDEPGSHPGQETIPDPAMERVTDLFPEEADRGDLPEAPDPIGEAAALRGTGSRDRRDPEAPNLGVPGAPPDLDDLGPDGEEAFAARAEAEADIPAPGGLS